jgi:hypothetical protein
MTDLVQVDWDGNIVWKFEKYELVTDPGHEPTWMARQHHDYQREGNPVGYYVPGMDSMIDRGNTLILCHKNIQNSQNQPGIALRRHHNRGGLGRQAGLGMELQRSFR